MAEIMRGMRLGAQSRESDRFAKLADRKSIDFACPVGHEFSIVMAQEAELPDTWECKHCDQIALRIENGEPVSLKTEQQDGPRSHYDMVLERRSREELEELLQEVLEDMRKRRSSGRLTS